MHRRGCWPTAVSEDYEWVSQENLTKKRLVSQETLIKTLLQHKKTSNQQEFEGAQESLKIKVLAIILVAVVALSIGVWFFYSQTIQIYEPEVVITEFFSLGGWRNPVGVTLEVVFNVTVENTGISDIDGLTLEIKRLNLEEDAYNITKRLDILHAGETTEIQDSIITGIDHYAAEFLNRSFVATLKLGEVVLDERHLLPEQYP